MEKQRLSLSALLLSCSLLVSKCLGFLKESLMAKYFGASGSVDAYVAARATIEGISGLLTAGIAVSVVPVFAEFVTQGKEKEGWMFVRRAFRLLNGFVLALSILGILFAPHIVRFLFGGFSRSVHELTVVCLRGFFIYFFFVEMGSFLQSVHQASRRFSAIIFWQVIPNAVIILFILSFTQTLGIYSVVFGFLATGPLYFLLFYAAYARQASTKLSVFPGEKGAEGVDEGLRKMGRMVLPLMVGQSFGYVVFFVDRAIASYLQPGSMASLNYANRVIQLPQALLTIPVAMVLYPVFSYAKSNQDFVSSVYKGLRLTFFILLFPCLFCMVFSLPFIRVLFERGAFLPEDTLRVSVVLKFFSPFFLFSGLTHILIQAFFARQDSKTPVKVAIPFSFVNVFLSVVFARWLGLPGLAFSATLSVMAHFLYLVFLFIGKHKGSFSELVHHAYLYKMSLVALLTVFVMFGLRMVFESPFFLSSLEKRLFALFMTGMLSLSAYALSSFLLKVDEMQTVRNSVAPVWKKITGI